MAPSICLRCLARPLFSVETPYFPLTARTSAHTFSTSPSLSANPPKKRASNAKPAARQGSNLRLSKGTRTNVGRPPAPGERKALRKRVVLSNTNALEVPGLQDLHPDNISGDSLGTLQGQVLGLQNDTVDALRALETFKPTQRWSLFRRPASLVRRETVALAREIEGIANSEQPRTVRRTLFGARGSGKSVLMLQAMATAFLRGWVVVSVPEAHELTNAHTSYVPQPDGTYFQPHYTATLLGNLTKANYQILSTMQLSRQHKLPIPIQPNISLARFAELGARDPELAWPIWKALWSELTAPSQPSEDGLRRPPVMVALDGIHHIMRHSAYLNVDLKPIHAHDLLLVRHFVDLLSGETTLPNGGMVLAATSVSNKPTSVTLDHSLVRNEAQALQQDVPTLNPYTATDQRVLRAMQTVEAQRLRGLTKEEARGVMEYYAQSGMLRHSVTQGLVSEKWTLAGGGIIGELERGSIGLRF